MIDIEKKYLQIIRDILFYHVPQCDVRLFGSRFTGTARKYSDIDLAIVDKDRLDEETIIALKESFAESDLPYQVDVLDWHVISPKFKEMIETGFEVIQKGFSQNTMGRYQGKRI
jgi:predicted nucleotidyltransferase